ncbi:isg15 ubiquitin-like modifier [Anaeramoeba flamelloides]|uniref:Isg15 ubiquitin-like modifier n=1 Tax=Anaeramoeba flamelloides TaxID=1746091 RepID=A0AAV7ZLX5_9EUKA|nr:isg15 ubiquitin-like modifier [Anaeramoeba flamelloides]
MFWKKKKTTNLRLNNNNNNNNNRLVRNTQTTTSQNNSSQTNEADTETITITISTGMDIYGMPNLGLSNHSQGRSITVKPSITVRRLMELTNNLSTGQYQSQRVLFNNQTLSFDNTLASYNIGDGATLTIISTQWGGKPVINLYNYVNEEENKTSEKEKFQISSVKLQLEKDILFSSLYPMPKKRDFEQNSITWSNIKIEGKNEEQKISIGKRNYAYLFWECVKFVSVNSKSNRFCNLLEKQNSFCVNLQNLAEFLSDQLSMIGLTTKEINDLIIYWVPQLEQIDELEWVQVQFLDETSEYSKIAKLEIEPKPNVEKRIFVLFKPLKNQLFDLGEQLNIQPIGKREGKGFVAVEWGGMIL